MFLILLTSSHWSRWLSGYLCNNPRRLTTSLSSVNNLIDNKRQRDFIERNKRLQGERSMNKVRFILPLIFSWMNFGAVFAAVEYDEHQQESTVVQNGGYRTSHIASEHKINEFSKNGDVILEDNSIWKVKHEHLALLKDWNYYDPILVLQNHSNALYPYLLSNEATKIVVEAQVTGISDKSLYAMQIVNIWADEKENNWLKLRDGSERSSTWSLPKKESAVWSRWKVDEYVLVGTNHVWPTFVCLGLYPPNILINLSNRRRDHIQSKCVK